LPQTNDNLILLVTPLDPERIVFTLIVICPVTM